MGCEAGRCKTSTPEGIFIVTPSVEGSPTKAKEAPSPNEIRLALLDTNPVFQSLSIYTKLINMPAEILDKESATSIHYFQMFRLNISLS